MLSTNTRSRTVEAINHAVPAALSPRAAARYLDIPEGTLKRWRAARVGPRFVKVSRKKILYLRSDLDSWLDRLAINTEADSTSRGVA